MNMMRLAGAFLLLLPLACGRDPAPVLEVSAASTMQELVADCAGEWRRRGGVEIRAQFAASSTLARRIQEGASCDLFLSADAEWAAAVKGIERREWVGNHVVVVARRESAWPGLAACDTLALGDEAVPVGRLARAALRRLGVEPRRVVSGASARDVLSKVREGAAPAGIVFATDALVDAEVRVVESLPESTRHVIVLMEERARPLFVALGENWALEIARRRGFQP